MADYCKQCSKEIFDSILNDFYDLSVKDHPDGQYRTVLCDGCGQIQVTWDGTCVSEDCMGDHRK